MNCSGDRLTETKNSLPAQGREQSGVENVVAEREDLARLLGEPDELDGTDGAEVGMAPAGERLELADHAAPFGAWWIGWK